MREPPLDGALCAAESTDKLSLPKSTSLPVTSSDKLGSALPIRSRISCDESVSAAVHWQSSVLPTLYIDDFTVMEEVKDLTVLRHGDHCIVGLNPVRKASTLPGRPPVSEYPLSAPYWDVNLPGVLTETVAASTLYFHQLDIANGGLSDENNFVDPFYQI
ncbi:hypothetical protein CYMTET_31997 [Cymbomonas tetramitiformis]|uniref:Uncharacterized protein n=1 Tax=Cymbomonas tetramitiformis TaxID=36881 RepID=A0AAE0FFR0_9CHLO|nr:hypothetical protein CYMTET_31997 [Cymbomonas tetramitiformis]